MLTPKKSAGDNALASDFNKLRNDALGASQLSPHEQTVPNLTLYVEAGVYFIGGKAYSFAGGNSPSFTAPSANPRIDLLTINTSGTLERTAGSEAASPVAPKRPVDKYTICTVYNRVGQTKIYNAENAVAGEGYIYQDLRSFNREQNSYKGNTTYNVTESTGTVNTVTYSAAIPTTEQDCKFIRVQCRVTVVDNGQVFNAGANLFGFFDLNLAQHNNKLSYDIATQSFYMYKLSNTTWYQFYASLQVVDGTITLTVSGPDVSTGTHSYNITGTICFYD